MPDITVLCAADLHLGRRPAGLHGHGGSRISSAAGWRSLVDRARTDAVDLVVLAGDVVDELNRSFEAYGPLQRGIRTLKAAGIPVVAVAGNHDYDTLPDVAAEVGEGNLVVLGKGGKWERWSLQDEDGQALLHVDGWSFPDGSWKDDPTSGYEDASFDDPGEIPVLGLLHADLDQPGSPYGPVTKARLRSLPVSAWILGHVHGWSLDEKPGGPPILYPGSLQALKSGERGAHGAWIVDLGTDRTPTFRMTALSTVRYDRVEVDVGGVEDAAGLLAAIRRALQEHLDQLGEEATGPLRVAQARVVLTGQTGMHGQIAEALSDPGGLDLSHDSGLRLVVDPRPVIETEPELDLEALARGSDAPAMLARLLLDLAESTDGSEALPEKLAHEVSVAASEIAGRAHYVEANLHSVDVSPGSARLRDAVRGQAMRLLGALVAEKEVA